MLATSPTSARLASTRVVLDELASECARNAKCLVALASSYQEPLALMHSLTPQELALVFRNLGPLRDASAALASGLAAAADCASLGSALTAAAGAFEAAARGGALLAVYQQYAAGQGAAAHALRRVRARPEAARALAYIASQGRVEGEALEDLLLRPLEHARRLRELLLALHARLAPGDPGAQGIEAALHVLVEVAHACEVGAAAGASSEAASGSGLLQSALGAAAAAAAAAGSAASSQLRQQQQQQQPHPSIASSLDARTFAALDALLLATGAPLAGEPASGASASATASAAASAGLLAPSGLLRPSLSVIGSSDVPLDAQVVAAQLEADAAARALDDLERECSVGEAALAARRRGAGNGTGATSAASAAASGAAAALASFPAHNEAELRSALQAYVDMERELLAAVQGAAPARQLLDEYSTRRAALGEAEAALEAACRREEAAAAAAHEQLCGGSGSGDGSASASATSTPTSASASSRDGASGFVPPDQLMQALAAAPPLPEPSEPRARALYRSLRAAFRSAAATRAGARRARAEALAALAARLGAAEAVRCGEGARALGEAQAAVAGARARAAAGARALEAECDALCALEGESGVFREAVAGAVAAGAAGAAARAGAARAGAARAEALRGALAEAARAREAAVVGAEREAARAGEAALRGAREAAAAVAASEAAALEGFLAGLEESQGERLRSGFRGLLGEAASGLAAAEARVGELRRLVAARGEEAEAEAGAGAERGGGGGGGGGAGGGSQGGGGGSSSSGGSSVDGAAAAAAREGVFAQFEELGVPLEDQAQWLLAVQRALPFSTQELGVFDEGVV